MTTTEKLANNLHDIWNVRGWDGLAKHVQRMVLDARIEEQELVKSLGSLNTHPTAVAMKRLEELRSERNRIG